MIDLLKPFILRFVLVIGFISGATAFAQDEKKDEEEKEVVPIFPDKNLEKAVRKFVFEKRYNDEPIGAEDVKDLSTIKGVNMGIKDLTGLEHCRSLASIDLAHNAIVDLAPIANLKRLQYLDISDNNISEIETLSTIPRLQYIELSTNAVSDISPLAGLTNLNSLYLSHNRIKNIDPVVKLPKLWSLYLDNNRLENLHGVHNLGRLDTLCPQQSCRRYPPLFGLTDLYFLFLENNDIEDLSACKIVERDSKGERRFSPYLKVYVKGNPLNYGARRGQVDHIKNCGTGFFLTPDFHHQHASLWRCEGPVFG